MVHGWNPFKQKDWHLQSWPIDVIKHPRKHLLISWERSENAVRDRMASLELLWNCCPDIHCCILPLHILPLILYTVKSRHVMTAKSYTSSRFHS